MSAKLALKNFRKNFHDYAVYFITLVIGVAIFYMFNSVYAQQEIMSVTEATGKAMESLRNMLSYISVFVAVVLGFLIVYANSFFYETPKKRDGDLFDFRYAEIYGFPNAFVGNNFSCNNCSGCWAGCWFFWLSGNVCFYG